MVVYGFTRKSPAPPFPGAGPGGWGGLLRWAACSGRRWLVFGRKGFVGVRGKRRTE